MIRNFRGSIENQARRGSVELLLCRLSHHENFSANTTGVPCSPSQTYGTLISHGLHTMLMQLEKYQFKVSTTLINCRYIQEFFDAASERKAAVISAAVSLLFEAFDNKRAEYHRRRSSRVTMT